MQDLSSARAVARCGCRVSELKAFPRSIIDSHCEVFVFIEEGADWPAELMDVHVHASALRKTSSAAPDEGGEDFILPPAAKTRIINNSPPNRALGEGNAGKRGYMAGIMGLNNKARCPTRPLGPRDRDESRPRD